MNGARMVAQAIAGSDAKIIIVGGKAYSVAPLTIRQLAGAGQYLSELPEVATITDAINSITHAECLTKALSWLVRGDESLSGRFAGCPLNDVANGICEAMSTIDTAGFSALLASMRNVKTLIARPR